MHILHAGAFALRVSGWPRGCVCKARALSRSSLPVDARQGSRSGAAADVRLRGAVQRWPINRCGGSGARGAGFKPSRARPIERLVYPPTFDDVLTEALDRAAGEPCGWSWAGSRGASWTGASPFLFVRPLPGGAWTWQSAYPRPRRRPHAFTDEQRKAFERFTLLGATIGDDFSGEELRREYRRMARLYHPDGHPDAGTAELGGLAQRFADATWAYRILRTLVETRH